MLKKICAKCGKSLPKNESCSCEKLRHKLYNETRRDAEKNKFYNSEIWRKMTRIVKARAKGLDEYALSQGYLETGNTVHHIYPLEERPDLKLSLDNLIFVSARNHNRIHKIYNRDETSKKKLQAKLTEIICPVRRLESPTTR